MTAPSVEKVDGEAATLTLFREAPSWAGRKTAAIGGFSCKDSGAGQRLLMHTLTRLEREGFDCVIGPMDGDTWHAYRLILESDGSAPFALEPISAPHDVEAFTGAGFEPIENYVSSRLALEEAIGRPAPRLTDFSVTPWDGKDAAYLIEKVFEFSLEAFRHNNFYKPITEAHFLELYQPLLKLVDPRLVLFAFDAKGQIVGFAFGFPNFAEGADPKTAVLKSYASRVRGGGRFLSDCFHRAAHGLGYVSVIHALMHTENASWKSSTRYNAHVFRRYALMGRSLKDSLS